MLHLYMAVRRGDIPSMKYTQMHYSFTTFACSLSIIARKAPPREGTSLSLDSNLGLNTVTDH